MKLLILATALAAGLQAQKFQSPCYDVVAMKYNPAALPGAVPVPGGAKPTGYQIFVTALNGGECTGSKFVTIRLRYRTAVGVSRFLQDYAPVTKQANGSGSAVLLAEIGLDSVVQGVSIEPLPSIDVVNNAEVAEDSLHALLAQIKSMGAK